MNPQSINFLAAPPPLIAAKNMRTTLILPFAPLRMTRTAPDGYGELFVMNQNSPEMFNPQPILLRTPTDPTLSKTEWDVRLARIGESQKEKPEFLIDECYWEQRLSEIGAPQ